MDYISTWNNTYVQTAIEFVYNNGGVIGGNSAGMAILGQVVFDAEHGSLTSDQAAYNPYHYRLSLTDDLPSFPIPKPLKIVPSFRISAPVGLLWGQLTIQQDL